MTQGDIAARIRRLRQLAKGLAAQVGKGRGGEDPLGFAERRAYLRAVQDAVAAVANARVGQERVLERLPPA
jgi:hypothetical protein